VFSSGSYNWAWGLDSHHEDINFGSTTDISMQQAMVNLFADMSVQPSTLQSGLIAATASSDITRPSSIIAPPASSNFALGSVVAITGTASDTGGRVGGVEVSIDGGLTWHPASGRDNWNYVFTAITNGSLNIRSRAIDDSLNMEISGTGITVNVGTGADTTAPSVPANLTATVINGTQVNLDWTDSTDNVAVTRYQVERCQGAGCTNFGAAIGTPTISAFNNTGLTEGVTYRYRVSAGDAANNFSAYSSIVTVTPDVTPPAEPAGLTATAISSTQINLSWTASTDNVGVVSYQVERCPGSTCTNFGIVASPTASTLSDTSAGIAANTTYRYRVLAKDAAGNASAYSSIVSATTPAAPVAPVAVNDLFLYRSGVQRIANASGPRGLGVLANDTDSAGLPLNAVLVGTLPAGVSLASNGVVTATVSANTSFTYRSNNGALSSLPATGATVALRLNGTPVANADNCSYSVSANSDNGSIVSGSACAMTSTSKTFTMNLTANDTDPNKTTNIPTDGVGDDITSSIITSTGTGVDVAPNPACGQAAIVKTASRASVVNNCNGTLTVTSKVSTPPIFPVSATITYRVFDELGTQSGTRTNTITIQF
jgi:fibronectin type 3 domain-containing protein